MATFHRVLSPQVFLTGWMRTSRRKESLEIDTTIANLLYWRLSLFFEAAISVAGSK
jgi:hypothetical protein